MADDTATITRVDNRQAGIESVAKIIIDWESDSTGGTVLQSIGHISGSILALETNPGSPAPTDDYNITLEDPEGYDVLEGLGVDRDTATTEKTTILAEVTIGTNPYGAHPPVNDVLTFKIAAAGNSKQGRAVIFFR